MTSETTPLPQTRRFPVYDNGVHMGDAEPVPAPQPTQPQSALASVDEARAQVEQQPGEFTVSEQFAAEAEAEKLEYPPGTPDLVPVIRLPRRRRADYYRVLAKVSSYQEQAEELRASAAADVEPVVDSRTMQERIYRYADMVEMAAVIEDLLAIVAADEAAYREWATAADDHALIKVFNVYQAKAQPGEAERSSS